MGPVEYVVFGFPGNKFKGEIVPALSELIESRTIRILDLLFIVKDEEGNVEGFELQDLPEEIAGMAELTGDTASLLSDDDLAQAAESLAVNSSGALMVFENVWAERFVTAIRNADGELLAQERIPMQVVEAAFAAAQDET
jgi:hypothetical protein